MSNRHLSELVLWQSAWESRSLDLSAGIKDVQETPESSGPGLFKETILLKFFPPKSGFIFQLFLCPYLFIFLFYTFSFSILLEILAIRTR